MQLRSRPSALTVSMRTRPTRRRRHRSSRFLRVCGPRLQSSDLALGLLPSTASKLTASRRRSSTAPPTMPRFVKPWSGNGTGRSVARTWASSSKTSRTCKATNATSSSSLPPSAATAAGRSGATSGVLGQTGGERRLNVAVTRARSKVVLITSMPVKDVSDWLAAGRSPDKPRDYLQAYLDYATKVASGDLEAARITQEPSCKTSAAAQAERRGGDGRLRGVCGGFCAEPRP